MSVAGETPLHSVVPAPLNTSEVERVERETRVEKEKEDSRPPAVDASFDSFVQQFFNGGPSSQNEIMSQLESLIQRHNTTAAASAGGTGDVPSDTVGLPGVSTANPLDSVVIGSTRGVEPQFVLSNMNNDNTTRDTLLGGGMGVAQMHITKNNNAAKSSGTILERQPNTIRKKKKKHPRQDEDGGDGTAIKEGGVASKVAGSRANKFSSQYRGVTQHSRSGRFEAHMWVKDIRKQVYLGGYEHEEHAAEAYDIAALKAKGKTTRTNFDLSKYEDLLDCIDRMTLDELIMAIRRQSQGFSRGTSSYRGVTKHPSSRWEARVGIPGSRHVYLGLYNDEETAARVYDQALVRLRGKSAATNFSLSEYKDALADFHHMQGRILLGDKNFLMITGDPKAYEQWLKYGFDGVLEKLPENQKVFDQIDITKLIEDDLRQIQSNHSHRRGGASTSIDGDLDLLDLESFNDRFGPAMEAITNFQQNLSKQ